MNYYLIKFELSSVNRMNTQETRLICMSQYNDAIIRQTLQEEIGSLGKIGHIWNLTTEIEDDTCDASEIDIY